MIKFDKFIFEGVSLKLCVMESMFVLNFDTGEPKGYGVGEIIREEVLLSTCVIYQIFYFGSNKQLLYLKKQHNYRIDRFLIFFIAKKRFSLKFTASYRSVVGLSSWKPGLGS